jgi:hypothetical protein
MGEVLSMDQVKELPWVSEDDLRDAQENAAAYGAAWAKIVVRDGDVRLINLPPLKGMTR